MFRFSKKTLSGEEFRKKLRSATRILVSDSILASHSVFDALANAIAEARPFLQFNVILGTTAVKSPDMPVLDKLKAQKLLRCGADGRPMTAPLPFTKIAQKLRGENLNGPIVLVTADDKEGEEFVRLTYESNFINELYAFSFGAAPAEYVCMPPVEKLTFEVRSTEDYDSFNIAFGQGLFGTTVRYVFDESKPCTVCGKKREGSGFVYTLDINRYDLFDCDKAVFIAQKKGAKLTSDPYSFVFSKAQYWRVGERGGKLIGVVSIAENPAAASVPTSTAPPSPTVPSHGTPASGAAVPTTPVAPVRRPAATVVRPSSTVRPLPLVSRPVAVNPVRFVSVAPAGMPAKEAYSVTPVTAEEKYEYYTGSSRLPSDRQIDVKLPIAGVYNLVDKDGKKIVVYIDRMIGSGGEGNVYPTDVPGVVAKILTNENGNNRTVNRRNKIELMQSKPCKNPYVAWPLSALYDGSGNFVGFLMKEVRGIELRKFYNDANLDGALVKMTRTQIVRMIVRILEIFVYLHERNILVGDIKEENIVLVKQAGEYIPYFVDCDSYQICPYPATKVSEGFVPPELCNGINVSTVYRTFGNEGFALFSLLFSILHKGVRPYSQRQTDGYVFDDDELKPVIKGWFPYSEDEKETFKRIPPAAFGNWSHLPGYLKKAFVSVGREGGKNFGEGNRLTSKDWLRLFRQYERDLSSPSSKLRSADPDCDIGMFMPVKCSKGLDFRVIDFKKIDFDMRAAGGEAYALTVDEAVRRLAAESGESLPVTSIVSNLKTAGKATAGGYVFMLETDIGIAKKVSFRCVT